MTSPQIFSRAAWAALCCGFLVFPLAPSQAMEFNLQRRDPQTGAASISRENLDPRQTALVIVDMWNWHWCKTSTQRVGSLAPRMAEVVARSREMGMTIFWCPSDVADNYVGTPAYEAAFNVPKRPLPALRKIECPPAPDGGGCTCGPERCLGNYGWDAMNPDLRVADADLMPNDLETLYSICRDRGITHLIYMGVHTQVCLLGKSIGLLNLSKAGFSCLLARDLTDAHGMYDPVKKITPDDFTAKVVEHFEKYLAATINFAEDLRRAGHWQQARPVDPVRVTPWGVPARPHLFPKEITVTLTTPWQPQAEIHYTVDGSEPGMASARYTGPLQIRETTHLRAMAWQNGEPVCLPSEGFFARLPEAPPMPDVHIADLTPVRVAGPGHSPSSSDHRYSPVSSPPHKDRSNRQAGLRLRGQDYQRGMGVHAPNQLVYQVKPEYERFVALAGVDERILEVNNGSNLAKYPSVVFKVILDGRCAAASPVMKISEVPWRFNVPIPPGSRQISLVAADAGDGNREDLANWVNAGFVRKK